MTFDEFCKEIVDSISKYLPEYSIEKVSVDKVYKNNGVQCTGVVILLKDESVAPNIYLDYYYMLYKQGRNLDDILNLLRHEYLKARVTIDDTNFTLEFDGIRDNAIIKLVNYEKNKQTLSNCPHIKFLDLAITFRYMVKYDDSGIASAMISNKDIEKWQITQEELYDIAMENTKRLFPHTIRCIDEILKNIDDICPEVEERKRLYVLTNDAGINGATSILYDDVIRDFARERKENLFIIPSSIHEMILICCSDCEKDKLKKLVREINKFIVSEMDYLSDNVYFYDLETDKIVI